MIKSSASLEHKIFARIHTHWWMTPSPHEHASPPCCSASWTYPLPSVLISALVTARQLHTEVSSLASFMISKVWKLLWVMTSKKQNQKFEKKPPIFTKKGAQNYDLPTNAMIQGGLGSTTRRKKEHRGVMWRASLCVLCTYGQKPPSQRQNSKEFNAVSFFLRHLCVWGSASQFSLSFINRA